MSAPLISNNLLAYALQIGLLVAVGASLPSLLRLRTPRARLLYWQLLLISCVALPWIRPWHEAVVSVSAARITMTSTIIRVGGSGAGGFKFPPLAEIALWLLAAGTLARLLWLAAGMRKLSRYRRSGESVPVPSGWSGAAAKAKLLVSDEVSGPVTFGYFRPVVLLPAAFPALSDAMREAILFHELLHVERRDWLYTVGEEIARAVFWFHPAIWWVLGEIQLAREQTVDQTVVEMTQARERYVDTLLAMAGVGAQMDLAPAPLFLRRRHLKQRVKGMMEECAMSKTRLAMAQIAAICLMIAACWFVTGAFPLQAAPQAVMDSPGVSVNMNGAELMHRSPVVYPVGALTKGVEGTVVVQTKLDANGEVTDASVLSGPDELRKSALQSILTWHFDKSAALTTRVVNIDFVKPAPAQATAAFVVVGAARLSPISIEQAQQLQESARPVQVQPMPTMWHSFPQEQNAAPPRNVGNIGSIDVTGISDFAREQLLAQLPMHVGDAWSPDMTSKIVAAATAFDSHLTSQIGFLPNGDAAVRISLPQTALPLTFTPGGPLPMRIGGNVQAVNLINQVRPVYPPLAKAARQQGTVRLEATIAKDGTVKDLKVISGPPLLIKAAMDSVRQWVYKPTLLNATPVEVLTNVTVNFSLSENVPAPPSTEN